MAFGLKKKKQKLGFNIMEGEIEMSKRTCIISNLCLIVWFFMDMVGFRIGNFILVQSAWKDDGVFFLIYVVLFLFFCLKERQGKYLLTVFLSLETSNICDTDLLNILVY